MPIILNSESIEEATFPGWAVVIFILVFFAMVIPLIIMVWGIVYEEYLEPFIDYVIEKIEELRSGRE